MKSILTESYSSIMLYIVPLKLVLFSVEDTGMIYLGNVVLMALIVLAVTGLIV